jgi:hypothetical protein
LPLRDIQQEHELLLKQKSPNPPLKEEGDFFNKVKIKLPLKTEMFYTKNE